MQVTEERPMVLSILLWAEVIVAARILLFAIPVIMQRTLEQNAVYVYTMNDWFLGSFAIPAFFYFVIAIAALMGHHLWRFLHFAIIFMTCFLTGTFVLMVIRTGNPLHFYYFLPAVISVGIMAYMITLKKMQG